MAKRKVGSSQMENCLFQMKTVFTSVTDFLLDLMISILRCPQALISPLTGVVVTERENQVLRYGDVYNDVCQSFLVWRKRMVFVSIPLLTVSVIPQLIDDFSSDAQDLSYDNGGSECTYLGNAAFYSQRISPACVLVGAVVGTYFWTDFAKSKKAFIWGWALGLFLAFWSFLVPVYMLQTNMGEGLTDVAARYEDRIAYGIKNILGSLPMFLAISGKNSKSIFSTGVITVI